ncbi:hypothetical protein NS365_05185 [Aureimonas ureilytica]|uniref:Uncharacterized protein n=1 Tax=Aureimonas ureilytica TaxID=401562 RepID=A0A175RUD4_9HYPH|nr:hypothetical protein [Aureimonas ureilytica]KTR07043.1 hypothetical protein NS365_05185 [Aureimonas ureilytica]
MVQAIRSFEEGLRKGLGIVIRCDPCNARTIYRCLDFQGFIAPGADIEALNWRCSGCRTRSTYVRYTLLDKLERESLAQWKAPPAMRRRF